MATTDTRPGFRLPWGGDRDAQATAVATETAEETTGPEGVESPGTPETKQIDSEAAAIAPGESGEASTGTGHEAVAAHHEAPTVPFGASAFAPPPAAAAPAKKPTKFLADLTRAMLAAAQAERAEIVEHFQAEAKTFTESIHERSASDAVDLRKGADEDIAGIRDWSKAEIARIREQTEQRISERKRDLDEELEAHAARIEREIERIRTTVDAYEARMARFIEDLSAIEDPTRFASMAETMPEPPSLEDVAAGLVSLAPPAAEVPAAIETVAEASLAEATAAAEPEPVAESEAAAAPTPDDDPWRGVSFGGATAAGEIVEDLEATAGASTVETGDVASTDDVTESTSADEAIETTAAASEVAATTDDEASIQTPAETSDSGDVDPRVTALGLTPDLAAAEAEALQGASSAEDGSDDGSADDVPAMDDQAIAARLASLTAPGDPAVEPTRTQVVVTGLASVASISGFKRTLAQLAGVRQVSVASGPDGEFVFSVTHGPAVDLAATIPAISGFAARVVSTSDGVLRVAAHDPENAG